MYTDAMKDVYTTSHYEESDDVLDHVKGPDAGESVASFAGRMQAQRNLLAALILQNDQEYRDAGACFISSDAFADNCRHQLKKSSALCYDE